MQPLTQRFVIFGKVQGVGFRFFTRKKANALGLTGYVRNLIDGSVEVVACGNKAELLALEKFFTQGIPSARVTQVITTPYHGTAHFTDFTVRY